MHRVLCPIIAWLCVSQSIASAALMVLSYDPAQHDRFYVGGDKDFIGDPYDWSGVARRTDSNTRWATMISPSYFLSAEHYYPGAGANLRFFKTNDPNGPYEDHVVVSGQQILTTDLWVGKLSTPVSDDIAKYAVLGLPNNSDYVGREIHVYGKSNTSPSETNMRMGRNTITLVGSYLQWSYNDPGLGADECKTVSGDSGAGSFTIFNNVPTLLGIHYFSNGDTFVPKYIDAINAVMVGESLSVMRIPEPSAMMLLALGLPGMALWRRRRRGYS